MLKRELFERNFCVRKTSDLSRVFTREKFNELPTGAVVHTSDNFDKVTEEPPPAVPDLQSGVFPMPPEQKVIWFPTPEDVTEGPMTVDWNGLRVLTRGTVQQIKTFQRDNARTIRLAKKPDELPEMSARRAFICYNPLYRVHSVGRNIQMRLFNAISASTVNVVSRIPERYHVLHYDLQPFSYIRRDFEVVYDSMDWRKMPYPNSMQYHLLLHLLMYCTEKYRNKSMFEQIPENAASNVAIVLTCRDKVLAYTLHQLRELSLTVSRFSVRVFGQLNMFLEGPENPEGSGTERLPYNLNTASNPAHESISFIESARSLRSEGEEITSDEFRGLLVNAAKVKPDPAFAAALEKLDATDMVNLNEELISKLEEAADEMERHPPADVPGFFGVPRVTYAGLVNDSNDFLRQREEETDKRVDNNQMLSQGQKARAKSVARAWRNMSFTDGDGNEVVFAKLLTAYPPDAPDANHIDRLEGQLRDPSMLDSSIQNMDSDYIRHGMMQDLAQSLMSIPGMHPQDMSVERIDDSVNRLDVYTVKFEDENQKMHTVRFTLPVIDDDGLCLVNGSEKTMTKQRINMPICKISPTRVSLSSWYNKTMVERHDAVAYDFFANIRRVLDKGDYTVRWANRYPFKAGNTLSFENKELEQFNKAAEKNSPFVVVRVGKDAESLLESESHHLTYSDGDLMVVRMDKTTKGEEYKGPLKVSASQKRSIAEADVAVIMAVTPTSVPVNLPYQYTAMARKLASVSKGSLKLTFDWFARFQNLEPDNIEKVRNLEKGTGFTYLGSLGQSDLFITVGDSLFILDEKGGPTETTLIDLLHNHAKVPVKPFIEWVDMQLLNKSVPVGFILCYRFGLLQMLEYMNVSYDRMAKNARISPARKSSDVILTFADEKIVIRKADMTTRLVFSGLTHFDIREMQLDAMNGRDAYYELFELKGISTNYIKGIDNFFDLFIDWHTRKVLLQMGEPVNFRDLLLRAVQLLNTEDYLEPSSTKCNMIRTFDRMIATIYNEVSRAFATYRGGALGSKDKMSIDPYIVLQRVVGDQLMVNSDTINPMNEFKRISKISHLGDGGRSEQTFMVRDRRFTKDDVGVLSEANVDSGSVAVTASTSVNPNIKTMTGMAQGVEPGEVTPSQLLSITGVLQPGVLQDSPPRANFANVQATHVVPTEGSDVYPVTTGYEKVLAHRMRPPFAYTAKDDGKITNVDEETGMVEVTYKSGEVDTFRVGEQWSKNPGQGMDIQQYMVLHGFKNGSSFKKEDVIAYNPSFFKPAGDKQVISSMGVTANVAFMENDTTLEDSSLIRKPLAERLTFGSVHTREVVIDISTTIHNMVSLDQEVASTDALMVFDEAALPDGGSSNAELTTLLEELNRATPRAEFDGKVIDMEAFHAVDMAEMSPTVAKAVEQANFRNNNRAQFSQNGKSSNKFPKYDKLEKTDRVGITDLGKDRVMFRFHIRHLSEMGGGSKLIYSSSLKSVITRVEQTPITGVDNGVNVDAVSSWRGVQNRLVTGVLCTGTVARTMEELNNQIGRILDK